MQVSCGFACSESETAMSDPVETTKSVADAVKSASGATQKGLILVDKACNWISRLFGADAGGMIRDIMYFYRAKNALALQEKLDTHLAERGISTPKKMPLRLSIPFLQAATLEDDPSLQEQWARLLANAMDPSLDIEMERSYATILRDMSPLECRVLEKIAQMPQGKGHPEITMERLASELDIELSSVNVALCGLSRQRLLEKKPRGNMVLSDVSTWTFEKGAFYLTELGIRFVLACSENPKAYMDERARRAPEENGKLKNPGTWQPWKEE
jgi:hypothetical protein